MYKAFPGGAAEGEPRQRGKTDGDDSGDGERQPAPVGDQYNGKQQSELRFVGEEAKANAGEERPPFQQGERAADQRRGEETVLPRGRVPQHRGKTKREENPDASAEDAAQSRRVGGERREEPDDGGDEIRQRRERRGNEQKWRRIMPAVIIGEVVADGADFGGLV